MMANATLPAPQRCKYINTFHALYRTTADEGVLALWKGAGPTVVRAMALNMGMLASYDQSGRLIGLVAANVRLSSEDLQPLEMVSLLGDSYFGGGGPLSHNQF